MPSLLRSSSFAAAVLATSSMLLVAAPAHASKMPAHILRSATKDRFITTMRENLPMVRVDMLGASDQEPQQLHLALTGDPTVMGISWVTGVRVADPTVMWWPGSGTPMPSSPSSSSGLWGTYIAGSGWTGTTFVANMTGLTPVCS
jgi:hypothetical protein